MTFCLMYVLFLGSSLKDKDLETTVWICVDLGKYQGHEMTRVILITEIESDFDLRLMCIVMVTWKSFHGRCDLMDFEQVEKLQGTFLGTPNCRLKSETTKMVGKIT